MNLQILNSIKKNSAYAIIPARSGSKSVKDKNIRDIKGFPMIAYSIAAAKLVSDIERVIVSTDSEKYAKIAECYGAEVPFLRPSEISSDTATDIEFVKHAIDWFYNNEHYVPEYWVHLRVTCPIRNSEIISNAIKVIEKHPESTCLLSVNLVDDYLTAYKWLIKDGNDYIKSIFFENNDDANRPRQSYPDPYIPNAYVDILKTETIVKDNMLHGNRMVYLETEKTIDVDTLEDLHKLNFSNFEAASELIDYLRRFK